MATSQTNFRSISLPSRLHPFNPKNFETELEKLKSWQVSVSAEAIQSGFVRLAVLYNSVHRLSQSPATQTSVFLHHHQDEKSMQKSLSFSVDLLDSCSSIRELVQMMRENVQALQSALRRKGLDSSIQNDITSYICFRRKMTKCIAKSLKTLKNLENKNGSNLSLSGDESSISVLREVSGLTIAIFKCTLALLSSSTVVKHRGWNLVSRLIFTKSVASGKVHSVISEVGCVDLALYNLKGNLRNSDYKALIDKQMVQRSLQKLESCIEGIEAGLERLFRQLLQSRATLLNIVIGH